MGDRPKQKFVKGHNALKKAPSKPSKKLTQSERKEQEEAEAAAVLNEYISDFTTGAVGGKTFVRSSEPLPTAVKKPPKLGSPAVSKPDLPTLADNLPAASFPAQGVYKPKSRMQELAEEFKKSKEITEEYKSQKEKIGKSGEKKKSNLELFKEELEQSQKEREIRKKIKKGDLTGISEDVLNNLPPTFFKQPTKGGVDDDFSYQYEGGGVGSHDNGDPATTNLFVSNINPQLNEEQLCKVFGKYGPLASVKIMWPRTEEEKSRNKNCGFVAFMNRKDGERCLDDIEGKYVMDFEMKIGWGKAVPIPPQPIYIHPSQARIVRPPKQSGLPFNCQISYKIRKSGDPFDGNLEKTVVKVVIPTERTILSLINRLVEFVVREGPMFEAMIMNREINNPMYRFLFDNKSNEHVYYRWRIFSLLQGDTTSTWNEGCFCLFKGGSVWQPPRMTSYGPNGMAVGLNSSAAIANSSAVNAHNLGNALPGVGDTEFSSLAMKKNQLLDHLLKENDDADETKEKKSLSDRQRDKLEDMLRTITTDRMKIGELMVWCVDHAECSAEIVECICESLSILETPIPTKIARLFVVNDILHNCSSKIPNVSNFRKDFQQYLVESMEHMHKALSTCSTKGQAEKFRKQVLSCLSAWQDWSLYPPQFLINLQNVFVGLSTKQEIQEKDSKIVPPSDEMDDEIDGDPITDDIDGIPIAKEEADLDEDIDGQVLLDDDIDGIPLIKDDIDGTPIKDNGLKKSKWEKDDPLSTSRWEMKSDDETSSTTVPSKKEKGGGKWQKVEEVEKVKPLVDADDSEDDDSSKEEEDESRRQFLREAEVKVTRFVDKLEQRGGSKSGLNIQKEAEKFRKQLIEEYNLKRAREQRRKQKSDRKRGRSNSPKDNESKRAKNSKKRNSSSSTSDSETEARPKSKSKKKSSSKVSSSSRSQSPISHSRSRSHSPNTATTTGRRSRSPSNSSAIFQDHRSRSPARRRSRSASFSPSPRRSSRRSNSANGRSSDRSRSRSPSKSSKKKKTKRGSSKR